MNQNSVVKRQPPVLLNMNLDSSLINWEMRKGRGWMKGVKEERLVKAKVCIKAPMRGLALCV